MVRLQQFRLTAMVLPLLFLILAGTAFARPKLVQSLGLDVWKMRQLEEEMQSSRKLSYSLDCQSHDIQEIITLNQIILTDLIAGRLDLTQAAKQKWELNSVHDFYHNYLNRTSTATGYEAKTAHDLITQACEVCDPNDRPFLAVRLENQYEAEYGITLPQ